MKIWKVAPGEKASMWPMCRDNGCIALGWLEGTDLSQLSREDIRKALLDEQEKSGGVRSIWPFVNEVQNGHIVVANKGLNQVVGVGLITSEYLPPNHPQNPSTDAKYRQSRRVDWIIKKEVPIQFSFGQQTAHSLSIENWKAIKGSYLTAYPNQEDIQMAIEKLDSALEQDRVESDDSSSVRPDSLNSGLPREQKALLETSGWTRNIILFGPPGTGKTFHVRQFAENFLRKQLEGAASTQQKRSSVLQDLSWHEAIALEMALSSKEKAQGKFKVNDLAASALIQDYAALKSSQKLTNALWAQMQIHTGPESETVKYTNRNEPFLFDKTTKSEWFLTDQGKEYVEANLGEALSSLSPDAKTQVKLESFFEFVTFHQSFAYEEFVEGLKPWVDESGQVSYKVVDGVFKRISKLAEKDPDNNYLLVIDEINRANISKVFGELITLLEDDKRIGCNHELRVRLPYSPTSERFGVPKNLYILGTMNTADRSIALLDLALRRRFTFVEMMPNSQLLAGLNVGGVAMDALLNCLNQRVEALLDRDHQIGHSYLMGVKDEQTLHFAWYRRIIPLLQEYFYNDGERLQAILGPVFVQPIKLADATKRAVKEFYQSDVPKLRVIQLAGEPFLTALKQLLKGDAIPVSVDDLEDDVISSGVEDE